MTIDHTEIADDLEAIQAEMLDCLARAKDLLCGTGIIQDRAEAYWLSHIEHALQQVNRYDTTMETTIKELRGTDEDEDEDGDEDED